MAEVTGQFVRPDDDGATVAAHKRVGADGGITRHKGAGCIADVRVAALEVATNKNLAAAVYTGGINVCPGTQANALTQHLDVTTDTAFTAGSGAD